jgi:hypothetical protein
MKEEYENEKASASFKGDDYVHADHPVEFTEGKHVDDVDLRTTDDDEEFPPEDHQFTWYVSPFV